MKKLKPEDLEKIAQTERRNLKLKKGHTRITVHMGTCGIAAGAMKIKNVLDSGLKNKNTQKIVVTTSGCAGLCSQEPMATVEVEGMAPVTYVNLSEEKIGHILEEHALGGKAILDYTLAEDKDSIPRLEEVDFFSKQYPIVLKIGA